MKYFLISVLIHLSIFLYTGFSWKEKTIAMKPNVDSNSQVIHVSLKLMEQEVQELEKKIKTIKKTKKATRKLVKVKNPVTKKQTVSTDKKSKLEGEKILQEYFAEIRSFIEKKKYYPKRALKMRQAGAVEICLDIDHKGHFYNVHIKKASRYSALNNAALSLIQEISSFKPLPKEMGKSITLNIPLKYALND